jgi:hypothetical protein
MNNMANLLGLIIWITGFVISKGFWPTMWCIFPPWSFYVVIEFALGLFL